MNRTILILCALLAVAGLSPNAHAQIALRGGGGLIVDGSIIGGHASVILPFSSKPAGVMLAAEYYKDSGATIMPISARGLYRGAVGESLSLYVGIGSGFIYRKTETGLVDFSSTKALLSAVLGFNKEMAGPIDLFCEGTLDRALVSGAKNHIAVKAGVALTFQE